MSEFDGLTYFFIRQHEHYLRLKLMLEYERYHRFNKLMKRLKILIAIMFALALAHSTNAQTEQTVCISQAAANACRDNTNELAAVKAKVTVLENALLEKDKSERELIERLHKTEVELGKATGELIGLRANDVSQRAIIAALLPMVRKKKIGVINLF